MGPKDFVPNRPPAFPRQPNLYLELLENKGKIRQDIVNQDYRPADSVKGIPFIEQDHPKQKDIGRMSPFSDEQSLKEPKDLPPVDYPDNLSDFSDNDSDVGEPRGMDVDRLSEVIDDLSDVEQETDYRQVHATFDAEVEDLSDAGESEGYYHPEERARSPREDIARELGGGGTPPPVATGGGAVTGGAPPTLSQLESGHRNYIPDAGQPSSLSAEETHQKKQELLDKFYTLKQKYKGANDIPEFTIHSDLATMERSYERTVRRLKIDSRIAWYGQMITYVFVGIEWFCSTIFKIDMSGYTQHQTLHRDSYESLLVELGERSYMPKNWNIPVELKLVGLILMNTALFIFSKLMMKKMGVNVLSFNTSSTIPQSTPGGKPASAKKMKEPDFDLDDLPV